TEPTSPATGDACALASGLFPASSWASMAPMPAPAPAAVLARSATVCAGAGAEDDTGPGWDAVEAAPRTTAPITAAAEAPPPPAAAAPEADVKAPPRVFADWPPPPPRAAAPSPAATEAVGKRPRSNVSNAPIESPAASGESCNSPQRGSRTTAL